jgi:CHAD domain-containing protein
MDEITMQSDPTALTTQQVLREVSHVKEFFTAEIDGMKTAIKVAHEDLVRVPTDVQKQVGNLKDLHEEKFIGIEKQFKERDVRSEQQTTSTKTAIDAALAAQEKQANKQAENFDKSIGKSEASFTKQIDGLQTQLQDVKDRVTTVESENRGKQQHSQGMSRNTGTILVIVSILIALVGLLTRFIGQ